ncbi:hypothetical protein AAKU64_001924 [Undibacterium sp. GrIS 1.8]
MRIKWILILSELDQVLIHESITHDAIDEKKPAIYAGFFKMSKII